MLIAQIEDLNEDFVKISRFYLTYFPEYNPSKNVTVGSDRFNLNDAASPKMVIKMYFNIFPIFLKLFECCTGNPFMTANRNFVRFGPS